MQQLGALEKPVLVAASIGAATRFLIEFGTKCKLLIARGADQASR